MAVVKKIQNFISFWYERYVMATELYMVEPWEKIVIHIVFGLIFWLLWCFNRNFVVSSIGQLRSGPNQFTEQLTK